ncbi:hypothetical protein [uncultured Treponema sp.]|uniref:hypothetical protein n=1 Tax=uncultured Treponema sp. TaxID=162155 RepID=UPI0026042593|nr:hypothetical protein [uncultured Treponema sp.]
MKSTFKFKSLFILLLAFAVSFVFVSCKDDSDDNSSQTPELRATYAATGKDGTYTICAGLNGKYEMYLSNASYGTILVSKGTYTIDSGDETNGTLSITTTGEMKNGSWVTVANPTPMSISVTNGQFTMKIGGNNYSFSKK